MSSNGSNVFGMRKPELDHRVLKKQAKHDIKLAMKKQNGLPASLSLHNRAFKMQPVAQKLGEKALTN